ncbi:MAG TPA: hypothetical protein VK034_18745 [Enhygromyxa sp.]|nr:hypothetical protein [Enhygromyxa sp.]
MTEPLASPTLALLYLAQGHRSRAKATIREVLSAEPGNGYALALLQRMQPRPHAQLHARFVASSTTGIDIGAGELELEWTIPDPLVLEDHQHHQLDVVVGFATRDRASLRFTSIPCLDRAAVQRIPAPLGPASAAVALLASKPCGPIVLLAVAEPISW